MSSYLQHCATYIGTVLLCAASLASVGCAPAGGSSDPDSETLAGAAEDAATADQGVSGSIPVGATLRATTGVNLRSGASTSKSVLHVVPDGATVTVQDSTPVNGFYKVKHSGTVGWSYGAYYDLAQLPDDDGDADEGTEDDDDSSGSGPRANAIARAKKAMGFSYWWGHGRFKDEGASASNRGSCSGSCPSCSHSGNYGGDCSGLAAKVWQVPSSNTSLSTDAHPYSTADFNQSTSQWSVVSRNNLQTADMMVYRSGGAGHIFVYGSGDAWGSPYAYECKGCSAGCVEGYRAASSAYKGIRKNGY
jgi:hypothetical protein